jgi:transposase
MSDHGVELFQVFVGIDWGGELHEVCVLSDQSTKRKTFRHSGDGLRALVRFLQEECLEGNAAIAIETPHGPVVESLQEAGFAVFSMNPKQVDRFRDRHSMAGAKDDRRDAFVLAEALRTDLAKFRSVPTPDATTVQLREISRWHDELGSDLRRASNRLRALLHRYFPSLLELCPAADEPWFWDLVRLAPNPTRARTIRASRIEAVLRKHRKRAFTAAEVTAAFRATPLCVAPGTAASLELRVLGLLPQLAATHENLIVCRKRLRELVAESGRLGEIVDSHPGLDIILTALILAEGHQALVERDLPRLRAHVGTAPVTRRSGKANATRMRRACNRRLRQGVRQWAFSAARCDPYARSLYKDMRQRGLAHERALRGLADRLLARLVATIRDDALYDPGRISSTAGAVNEQEVIAIA